MFLKVEKCLFHLDHDRSCLYKNEQEIVSTETKLQQLGLSESPS